MSFAALTIAGCGGGDRPAPAPADAVRAGAAAYLRALEDGRWDRACARMTGAARREIADAAGASCPRALAGGAALPRDQVATARREVPGADVRIDGATASIGPLGGLPAPLRLQRVGGRWLVSG
ncbi:MAG: hypothetical protein QOD73_849 [Solirubrobacteraceae bacterium]|nr:hypothetical protein [Solirubrobacteraceae bacterium]